MTRAFTPKVDLLALQTMAWRIATVSLYLADHPGPVFFTTNASLTELDHWPTQAWAEFSTSHAITAMAHSKPYAFLVEGIALDAVHCLADSGTVFVGPLIHPALLVKAFRACDPMQWVMAFSVINGMPWPCAACVERPYTPDWTRPEQPVGDSSRGIVAQQPRYAAG